MAASARADTLLATRTAGDLGRLPETGRGSSSASGDDERDCDGELGAGEAAALLGLALARGLPGDCLRLGEGGLVARDAARFGLAAGACLCGCVSSPAYSSPL